MIVVLFNVFFFFYFVYLFFSLIVNYSCLVDRLFSFYETILDSFGHKLTNKHEEVSSATEDRRHCISLMHLVDCGQPKSFSSIISARPAFSSILGRLSGSPGCRGAGVPGFVE
jgi:hypothetical protein